MPTATTSLVPLETLERDSYLKRPNFKDNLGLSPWSVLCRAQIFRVLLLLRGLEAYPKP